MRSHRRFRIRPSELSEANRFVTELHRHHKKVQGHKFSIALELNGKVVGVAICGRPVSRYLDNGYILEVTRLCTDGTKNACSALYSAAARIAKELGYNKIITYILNSEEGISLIASGWEREEVGVGGLRWVRNDGFRFDSVQTLFGEEKKYPSELKQRWCKQL